jgi:hypothetical protein
VSVSSHPIVEAISGPTTIQPGATCMWQAIVAGGTAPYSYQWTNQGVYGGTGEYYTGSKDPGLGGNSFRLEVTVTDAAGASTTNETYVYEDSSAGPCVY